MSKKYIYLTQKDWVKSWIDGGPIPIRLARAYKAQERKEIYTPDENTNRFLRGISHKEISRFAEVKAGTLHLNVGQVKRGGIVVGQNVVYHESQYEGLILSFCNIFDPAIATKMGKLACVEIQDIDALKILIDKQLNLIGEIKDCTYTTDDDRGPFLKGIEDSWQKEFRIFWKPANMDTKVTLPPDIAIEKSLLH